MEDLKDRLNELQNHTNKEGSKNSSQNGSIKKQLRRLYKQKHRKPQSTKTPPIKKLKNHLGGELVGKKDKILKVARTYSMKNYGKIDLSSIYNYSQKDYEEFLKIDNIKYPEQLLFIDTETTGLAGGTGTIAFLVGLGWIENQRFHTLQYFLPKLERENTMLNHIKEIISRFTTIVSYNGKSFDVPLLTTRFLLNRKSAEIEDYSNIDLLHLSRSLWKHSTNNCQLTTIEEEKIEFYRDDDISGELIPSVYFNFLNNRGNIENTERIFTHNRFDIMSMLANLILVLRGLKKTDPSGDPGEDYAKGRHFRRRDKISRSIQHFKHVLEGDITENRRMKTLMELGSIYKKQKDYDEAIQYWQKAIKMNFPAIDPLIELAKYYEHKAKDFKRALQHSQKALNQVNPENEKRTREIKKRINRLKRKLKKKSK